MSESRKEQLNDMIYDTLSAVKVIGLSQAIMLSPKQIKAAQQRLEAGKPHRIMLELSPAELMMIEFAMINAACAVTNSQSTLAHVVRNKLIAWLGTTAESYISAFAIVDRATGGIPKEVFAACPCFNCVTEEVSGE